MERIVVMNTVFLVMKVGRIKRCRTSTYLVYDWLSISSSRSCLQDNHFGRNFFIYFCYSISI